MPMESTAKDRGVRKRYIKVLSLVFVAALPVLAGILLPDNLLALKLGLLGAPMLLALVMAFAGGLSQKVELTELGITASSLTRGKEQLLFEDIKEFSYQAVATIYSNGTLLTLHPKDPARSSLVFDPNVLSAADREKLFEILKTKQIEERQLTPKNMLISVLVGFCVFLGLVGLLLYWGLHQGPLGVCHHGAGPINQEAQSFPLRF